MKTIACVNLKGGVGKTATSVELAYGIVTRYKKRVLIVDADQNRGATKLLLPSEEGRNTITALLTGICDYPYDLIYKTRYEGMDIVPADEELASYGTSAFAHGECNIAALSDMCEALAGDDAYDVIIIDSAPGMAAAMACSVVAADTVVVPMTLDPLGISGMKDLVMQIDSVRKTKQSVRISGALVTIFEKSAETISDLEELRKTSPVPIFDRIIRKSPRVRSCYKAGRAIQDASPRCAASVDYRAFVPELLDREGVRW